MMDTCPIHLSKPIDYTTLRVSPNVSYGLWVILIYRLTTCNKQTTLRGDVDSGGVFACVGVRRHVRNCYTSLSVLL